MSDAPRIEKHSFRIDSIRQAADGVYLPLIDSVFLIVAINFFATGDFWKGLISASNFIGFLLSAPLTGALNRSGIPRSRILSALTLGASAALTAAVFAPSGPLFAIAVSLSSAAIHLRQPFFSDLYAEVYPKDSRARRISLGLRLNQLVSLGMGFLYGWLLEGNLGSWRWIFVITIAVLTASSLMLLRLPQEEGSARTERWWQALAMPFRNPIFLYVQSAWMLIGFANLWVLPLKAVYLVEEQRGLGFSPATVMLVLAIIPAAIRLLANPLWARLYHRLSFPALRIAINFFFLSSIPLFFFTDKLPVIILSAVLFGIGTSGSPFIWQLWVTRIVPPEETRIYQSAHAFLSGIRGIIAPFIGFAVLQDMSFRGMSLISLGLAMAATLMMLPLLRPDRSF